MTTAKARLQKAIREQIKLTDERYSKASDAFVAGAVGSAYVSIDGRLAKANLPEGTSGEVEVVNTGRPAAAVYGVKSAGGATTVVRGSSSSSGGDFRAAIAQAIASHKVESDPHPIYLTPSEASILYLSNTGTGQYQVPVTGATPYQATYQSLSSFAGNGLSFTSDFAVGQGDGITVSADAVSANINTAKGLSFVSGAITVNLDANSGLIFSGTGALALGTPGNVAVGSTNAVTGSSHSHAVVSSSNPGATASILATSPSGAVTINNAGSTTQPAVTVGDGNTGRLAIGGSGWLDDSSRLRMLGTRSFYVGATGEAKIEATSVVLGAATGSTIDFRASVLTGTSWSVTASGVATFADNTNTAHSFGMAKIGNLGINNAAAFGYRMAGATTYAFRQGASFSSYFNAGSGQYIYFRNNDVDNMILLPDGLRFELNKYVKTTGYVSGFAGSGWNIDQNISFPSETFAEFDNLSVRGTMRVYELLINQIRATNGTEIVSSVAKIASITGSTWQFEDPEDNNLCPFADDDLVIIQDVDVNSTTVVKRIVRRITSVTGDTVTVTAAAGGPTDVGTPKKGDSVVRFGNSTDPNRQGVVLLTSDFPNSPYIDVIYGVASWADWTGGSKTKMRIGKLTGITSTANEYGMIVGQSGFTSTDSYIKAGTSGIFLNKSDLKSYNGSAQTVWVQSDGDVFFGSNVAAVATTSFAHFGSAQTYGGEAMGVGDVVIGNKAAGHMMWDASTGRLNFRNNTTVHAYVSSTGELLAGGGAVRLNSSGIEIESFSSASGADLNSFKFVVSGTTVGAIYGNTTATENYIGTTANAAGKNGNVYLNAIGDSSHRATFVILAQSGKPTATDAQIYGVSDATSYITIGDVDYVSVYSGSAELQLNNFCRGVSSTWISEICNDRVSYKALSLFGNMSYDGSNRRVSIYDYLYVSQRVAVGLPGHLMDSLSSFVGQAVGGASSVSLSNTNWGNSAHLAFNAYMVSIAGSYTASGAWKFLGSQYTGDITRAGLLTFDGNAGQFRLQYSEAGVANGSNITTWTRIFEAGSGGIGFFGITPATRQTVTGSRGGNAALASVLTALASYGLIINSSS